MMKASQIKHLALVLALALILAALTGCSGANTYYTCVDNAKVETQTSQGGVIDPTGGMPYRYTLDAYDEKGAKTEMGFGTSRVLREGAYLKLTTAPLRGVIAWEEVLWEELPEKVRLQYQK